MLKKIGLGILGILGAILAFFSFQGKKTDKVLKENEKAMGHVDELGETIKEKLEEINIEKKKVKNLEKKKKEIPNEKDIDDNVDFINDKY